MQTYNKEAFRGLVDKYYEGLSTDISTLRGLWSIAYDYGNLETIPKTLSELPEGQNKDYIYDEIFTRLIEREYNENGSLEDFKDPSNIFYKLFEWVKKFFGVKYNREKEFSKLTTSSTVKDFYNILKKVDNLKVSKEEYIKGTNTNESIYNVYKILNNRKFEDLNTKEKEEVQKYMKEYNDYIKSLPKLSKDFVQGKQFQKLIEEESANNIHNAEIINPDLIQFAFDPWDSEQLENEGYTYIGNLDIEDYGYPENGNYPAYYKFEENNISTFAEQVLKCE